MEEKVYDADNSENEPWLMEQNLDEVFIDPKTNQPLTANYIWSQKGSLREELVNRIYEYLRTLEFKDIIPKLTNEELKDKYNSLINNNSYNLYDKENNLVINSNSLCTDVLKHFCGELFYSASGDGKKSYSCKEVFEDNEKLIKVLKNRMGYRTSKEDGRERPYIFAMSNKMILQGMRSSGLGYTISTFKPMLAKFIIEYIDKELLTYSSARVLDYSAGWGARALGVGSLNKEYYAIDPLTYDKVNELIKYYDIKGKVFNGGSENTNTYNEIYDQKLDKTFDIAFSSPPYFSLETYDKSSSEQSISKYPNYNDWLQGYWDNTVVNIKNVLRDDGIFVLVMLEKYKKFNLLDDMVDICKNNNFEVINVLDIKTSKSHLSGKKKSKEVSKNTEKIIFMKLK